MMETIDIRTHQGAKPMVEKERICSEISLEYANLKHFGVFMIVVELAESQSNFISAAGKSVISTFEVQVQGL